MTYSWAKKRTRNPRPWEADQPAEHLNETALILLEYIRASGNLGRNYRRAQAISKTGLNRDLVKYAEQDIRGSVFAGQFRPAHRVQIPKRTRWFVFNRDGWGCTDCPTRDQTRLTLGHVIPYSRGGSDHHTNLRAQCVDCNTNAADTEPTTLQESA